MEKQNQHKKLMLCYVMLCYFGSQISGFDVMKNKKHQNLMSLIL